MHEQPSTGRVVCNGGNSRDLGSIILQDLLYGVLFTVEGGLSDIERNFEYVGRCIGVLSGVEDAITGGQDLRQTSDPNCTFTVNHQVVEGALCEG